MPAVENEPIWTITPTSGLFVFIDAQVPETSWLRGGGAIVGECVVDVVGNDSKAAEAAAYSINPKVQKLADGTFRAVAPNSQSAAFQAASVTQKALKEGVQLQAHFHVRDATQELMRDAARDRGAGATAAGVAVRAPRGLSAQVVERDDAGNAKAILVRIN